MGTCWKANSKNESPKGKGQNTTYHFNVKNTQENKIIPNQLSPKDINNNNNILQIKNNSTADNNYDNKSSFPIGTKYEKELKSNFIFFDVFWYDPNNTKDFVNYKICFRRIRFIKESDLEKAKEFLLDES